MEYGCNHKGSVTAGNNCQKRKLERRKKLGRKLRLAAREVKSNKRKLGGVC